MRALASCSGVAGALPTSSKHCASSSAAAQRPTQHLTQRPAPSVRCSLRPVQSAARRAAVARRACAAAEGGGAEPALFAESLLLELAVPADRVAGTLSAANTLHGLPAAERPLHHVTAESPVASPDALELEGAAASLSAGVPPWRSSLAAVREGWAAAVRSHVATLRQLGLCEAECGAVLAAFPFALLLPREPGLRPAAELLAGLGLSEAELAAVVRSSPRLLGFSPAEHLAPAIDYLRGCGLGSAAVVGLLRQAPSLALGAVEHKARTDLAAKQLGAAYRLQSEERTQWAVESAASARAALQKRGW